jgi:hypothetical protein
MNTNFLMPKRESLLSDSGSRWFLSVLANAACYCC